MRWADLDQLNHVNNVVYVDYAMEARAQLVDEGLLENGRPVRRVCVDFLRPLLLSGKPVTVRSSVDGDVLTQEIRSHDGSALFSTVVTEHGQPESVDDPRGTPLEMRVRRSDVGPDGHGDRDPIVRAVPGDADPLVRLGHPAPPARTIRRGPGRARSR